jgi:quercetin dioxygenase-like cupin family protein
MTNTTLAPFVRRKSLDNTYAYSGGTISILAGGEDTGGAFAMWEGTQRPGSEPPLHIREREDETFYILEGEVAVMVDGNVHGLTTGDTIFLPRGLPHTFRIKSSVAKVITIATPAGFEQWFRTLGTPAKNFDLPEKVSPPTEEEFARIQRLAGQLGLQVVSQDVEF